MLLTDNAMENILSFAKEVTSQVHKMLIILNKVYDLRRIVHYINLPYSYKHVLLLTFIHKPFIDFIPQFIAVCMWGPNAH